MNVPTEKISHSQNAKLEFKKNLLHALNSDSNANFEIRQGLTLKRTNDVKNTFSSASLTVDKYNPFFLSPTSEAVARILERIFQIWEAGANKKGAFKTLYAYPPNSNKYKHLIGKNLLQIDTNEILPANLSESYADHFLNCLISRAKSIKDNTSAISISNRSRFFLIGDVGTGKTTFISSLFSRNYKALLKHKIMWIRVDLTKTYHSTKNLDKALDYQVSRIVRKSYFEEYFKHDPDFEQTIRNEYVLSLARGKVTQEEVENYIEEFYENYESEKTTPYHSKIQTGIRKYVQKHYAVIYIYDGFDRLRKGQKEFDKKLSHLQKHILGSEKREHLYIFVMRSTSHARALTKYLSTEIHSNAALRKVSQTFQVLPPKLFDVVRNRLKLLNTHWDRLLVEERHNFILSQVQDEKSSNDVNLNELENIMLSCKWLGEPEDLEHYYHIFLRFIYRGLHLSDHQSQPKYEDLELKTFRALKNVVGNNFRILLSFLTTLLRCYLMIIDNMRLDQISIKNMSIMLQERGPEWSNRNFRRILARHYLVTQSMLRNQPEYIHPFIYSRNKKDKLSVDIPEKMPFIFNVYRGANIDKSQNEKYHLLSKVRILQYLGIKSQSHRSDILGYVSNNFGYSFESLHCEMNELTTLGLVGRKPRHNEIGKMVYEYYLKRPGHHMISKLMFEYSYLEMILNDILVPESNHSDFLIENRKQGDRSLNERLKTIPRIMNFLLLVKAVEEKEKKHFELNAPENEETFSKFSSYKKLETSISTTLERMLKGKGKIICDKAISFMQSINQS